MIRIARKNLEWGPTVLAVVFLLGQVAADLYLPTVTANLIDRGVIRHDLNYIWHEGAIMLVVAALGLASAAVNVFFASTQGMRLGEKLRHQIYHHVLTFSSKEMAGFGNASLITRSTNDVVQVQTVMVQLLRMLLRAPIMLVAAIVMAYIREPRLTLVFAVALPILAVVVAAVMYFAVPLFKSIQKKTDRINLIFREGLTGVRVIRAFNQDQREQKRFRGANEDYTQTGIRAYTLVAMLLPGMTLVLSLTNVGIIWWGAHLIANMTMQVGNLLAFLTYATQIMMSFMMLSMVFVFVPRASASATRINAVLDTVPSVTDPAKPAVTSLQGRPASLRFDHVDFRYAGAEKLSLTDLNFTVKAGQTLAIIGGTGAGKSTLVNLIPRLFNVVKGAVLVDGARVDQVSQRTLHDQIAITQQKAVLFAGTVRSNLLFGNPRATEEQMWRALAIAQAADFIRAEGGLNAVVEQDGANFSGGQRQRLAIARTIIKRASIYIFDDSFSALDFKTDARVRHALRTDPELKHAVTVIVAQRVATVADADLILVLDDGRVVGQGTHAKLAATNQTYQEIISSQLAEGDDLNAPR